MFVVVRVDQLHAHSHTIANATNTAFQKRAHSERFADFAGVAYTVAAIGHDRHARDDFQIADLREIRQDVVLYAIGEISVFLFIAQILKRQNGDGLVDLARGHAGQKEETGSSGDDDADRDQHYQIPAKTRSRRSGRRSCADTLRSNV